MQIRLDGRTALITGGSKGLGRAMAEAFAEAGAAVAIVARRQSELDAAKAGIAGRFQGARIAAISADVSTSEGCAAAAQAALAALGPVDILVNNAGTSQRGPFMEVDDALWQADLDLKLFAAIRTMRLAAPHMQAAGGGSIINVVNIGAKAPAASSTPTSVSRAAGIALTKAASKDLAKHQIRVNAVCIGLIKSEQHARRARAAGREHELDAVYVEMAKERAVPLGRVGEADEVGDLIAFLVSGRGRYISGTAINMDGGAAATV